MEILLEYWRYLLPVALAIVLLLAIRSAVRKSRDQKKRAFTRKLETVLQPRENIKLICPQKNGRVIMTSRRLLFETERGFQAVPFKTIKRVQAVNQDGKKTTSVDKMASLTLKADKEHTIANTAPEFAQLAKQLIRKVESQNKKKAAQKEKGKKK